MDCRDTVYGSLLCKGMWDKGCFSLFEKNHNFDGRNNMAKVTLGATGITTEKNSFGALPIQRISRQEAVGLLRKA